MSAIKQDHHQAWFHRFQDWKKSGEGLTRWCRQHDILLSSMQYWREKFEPLGREVDKQQRRSEWLQRLQDWRNSGEAITRWCRRHDIALSSMQGWRDRFEESADVGVLTKGRQTETCGTAPAITSPKLPCESSCTEPRSLFIELPPDEDAASPCINLKAPGIIFIMDQAYDAHAARLCLELLRAKLC